MNKEIIFSAKEYKEKYNDLLESYLSNDYEDIEQIDFIESEILLYEKYKSINFSLRTSNHFAGRTLSEGYNVILNAMEKQIRDKIYSIDNEFNEQLFKNVTLSFTKIIDFLELQKLNPSPTTKTNPKHENIFSNNGFVLFEYILNEYFKPKGMLGRYEDLSYYYRRLFEDEFIHQKSEPFKVWFIEKYEDEFSKIKTKDQVQTPQRNKDYSNALNWFKLQNK